MKKETYEWYKEHHICVRCGQRDADAGRTLCLECRFKEIERARKYKEKHLSAVTEYQREYMRQRRKYCKENQICIQCGKPTNGASYCPMHTALRRQRSEDKRREEGVMPRYLMGNGEFCYFCGKTVENIGDKTCGKCHARQAKAGENARKYIDYKNHKWRGLNETAVKGGSAE